MSLMEETTSLSRLKVAEMARAENSGDEVKAAANRVNGPEPRKMATTTSGRVLPPIYYQ